MKYLIKYDTMEDFYEHEGEEVSCEGVVLRNRGHEETYEMSYNPSEQAITEIIIGGMEFPEIENVVLENGEYVSIQIDGPGEEFESHYTGIYVETNQTGTTTVTGGGETYEAEYRIYTAKTGQGMLYGVEKMTMGGEVIFERGDGAQATLDLANPGNGMFALLKYKADNADCVTSIIPGVAALAENTEKVFYNGTPEQFEVTVNSWIGDHSYDFPTSSITYTTKKVPLRELISTVYDNEDSHQYRKWTFTLEDGRESDRIAIDLYDEMPTVDDVVAAIKARNVTWKYYDFQKERFKSEAYGEVLRIITNRIQDN